ncbi:MAG: hypothetical protein GXO77_05260 [Calditrichaeota bacterium]|nr:hypothetical protein [Calditrichota bacterium]
MRFSFILFYLTFVLILSGCTPSPIRPYQPVKSTFDGNCTFDDAWDATLDVLLNLKYQINFVDKESGVISTKTRTIDLNEALQYSYYDMESVYGACDVFEQTVTIRLKEINSNKVRITITPEFTGKEFLSDNKIQEYRFLTNGRFERFFVDKLNGVLLRRENESAL